MNNGKLVRPTTTKFIHVYKLNLKTHIWQECHNFVVVYHGKFKQMSNYHSERDGISIHCKVNEHC